ncbi:cell wall-binding repeat-containing protein [Clostridioides difficile]|uniref:cell wall-binding repeat-containing protein n=1 Tax=Clostridioides difficile TaxID=1496 RepID=UPI00097FD68A|nr:cell wall-binding repeat-containing protein [Clostridioides difficile]MCR1462948.1 cell wall-binding repeat-containing protein [Clostridioides difficile]MCV2272101.1 cell wall-binding repeat-containing protein [Clostridioides difficile]MDI3115637.1 cell wall-binding repeat-containing protein [Clostridioides difficile]MDV9709417.1 cell wall-binding repeat-containing protein [Clostridioides difficile]MDW0089748.1 cell wall-binding repeat-containing protein [Clostridioides difficile]
MNQKLKKLTICILTFAIIPLNYSNVFADYDLNKIFNKQIQDKNLRRVNKITITYDDNGATGGTINEAIVSGGSFIPGAVITGPIEYDLDDFTSYLALSNNLTRANYHTDAWSVSSDHLTSGTQPYSGGEWVGGIGIDRDITLYAIWVPDFLQVRYNGNGNTSGSVPLDSNKYYQSDTLQIKGNEGDLKKTNYKLTEWNTKADGTGTSYNLSSSFEVVLNAFDNFNIDLYAQWEYDLQLDSNGATGTIPDLPRPGEDDKFPGQGGLINGDEEFIGWNTEEDGSGRDFKEGDPIPPDVIGDKIYAQWGYKLDYNLNGGSGVISEEKHKKGAEVTVTSQIPSKSGAVFKGWNTKNDGRGIPYEDGDKFNLTKNTTLFAQWKEECRVTYDKNGSVGTAPIDNNTYEEGDEVTVLGDNGLVAPVAGSGNFYWSTKADDTGSRYKEGEKFNIEEKNTVLYAFWTDKCRVKYDSNGGQGDTPGDELIDKNNSTTVKENTGNLNREGYIFIGWNTERDGSGTSYKGDGSDTLNVDDNIVLYAQWEKIPDNQGGNDNSGGNNNGNNGGSSGGGGGSSTDTTSPSVENLTGDDRYETAIRISKRGFESAENVILVNSTSIPDALSATPFSYTKNAPILLTEKDKLNANIEEEIKRLKAKNIYIMGGENTVSSDLEKELKLKGFTIIRIGGVDRYSTSLKIAKEIDKIVDLEKIFVANGQTGLADAISVGGISAQNKAPIILTNIKNDITPIKKFIDDEEISKSYIIGGETSLPKSIEKQFPNSKRIGGEDRNKTNSKVIEEFYKDKELRNLYVTKNGIIRESDLIDALTVGVLAGKNKSPVMIVEKSLDESQKNLVKSKKFDKITKVGGNGNEDVFDEIKKLVK